MAFDLGGATMLNGLDELLAKRGALRIAAQHRRDVLSQQQTENENRAKVTAIAEQNARGQEEDRQAEAQKRQFETGLGYAKTLSPGQVITPGQQQGLGPLAGLAQQEPGLQATQSAGYASMPGAAAPESGRITTQTTGPSQLRYGGTADQLQAQEKANRLQGYIRSLDPNSAEARGLRYEDATGKNAPAGVFDKAEKPNQSVYRINPRTGKMEQLGSVPPGSHFATEPAPPSAAPNDNRLDRSYQYNNTALEKVAKPLEDQAARLERLVTSINQNSPQADALLAPELLTVMAGGQGSGLRINEAEISRVIGGRTNLESMKAALNKWQIDPSKGLSVTPAQRQQMMALVQEVSKRSQAQLNQIDQARSDLVGASDVNQHRTIVAKLHQAMRGGSATGSTPGDPLGIR